jgi:pentatricopeptide repeat protein
MNSHGKAISLYKLMLDETEGADNYTYLILVQACAIWLSEFEGKQMHDHVLKVGFDSDVYVQNTLINMCAECGKMGDARRLFDESPIVLDRAILLLSSRKASSGPPSCKLL